MVSSRTRFTTAALAALALAACASGPAADGGRPAPAAPAAGAPTSATTPDAAEQSRLEALYRARQDSARSRYTDADVAFMTGMIMHHAQALIMSELAPQNGAGPAVRRLAARINRSQQEEIQRMQRWLRQRGEPVPEVEIDGLRLIMHGMETGMGHEMDHDMDHEMDHRGDRPMMPGMLTRAQLEELAAARGTEFDRLFLTGMIGHHQGAVVMVRDLFAQDGAGQDEAAFKLASDINVDQRTEIARMRLLLESLRPEGADPPTR